MLPFSLIAGPKTGKFLHCFVKPFGRQPTPEILQMDSLITIIIIS